MLDREKLFKEIDRVWPTLLRGSTTVTWLTESVWTQLWQDESFLASIEVARKENDMPFWLQNPANISSINQSLPSYAVCAADGSQIYPDRHLKGIDCFLVNAGACLLSYGQSSSAQFYCQPYVHTEPVRFGSVVLRDVSPDVVDALRQDYEFELLLRVSCEWLIKQGTAVPYVALFDGNLLFWHLETKGTSIKSTFFPRYLNYLEQFYQHRIICAGYLSMPHFKDIVALISAGLRDCKIPLSDLVRSVSIDEYTTDVSLLASVLAPGQRTEIFVCNTSLSEVYAPHLRPCFFYLHVGSEIVRIEICQWVAERDDLISQLCSLCFDQSTKGYGYPVALAESHAQAVVKSADRDFFYQILYQRASRNNLSVGFSSKSQKKKSMGI